MVASVCGILITFCQATPVEFDFRTTSTWNSSMGTTTGYPATLAASSTNTNTIYTASQTSGGVTLTFTSSLGGSAAYGTRNLYDLATPNNPVGFNLSTKASHNNISVNGVSDTVATSGNLTNYQKWSFSFSEPVKLSSLSIDDIDNNLAATNLW